MTSPLPRPSWWRVTFTAEGRVDRVIPIRFDDGVEGWTMVEAPSIEAARKKAARLYAARKKRLAKSRHHAAGRCACGRDQDRFHPKGGRMLTCSVCSVRQKTYHESHAERVALGTVGQEPRDERARVANNLARQRDRRGELRLETLVEVRRVWVEMTNVGRFTRWLDSEIDSLTARRETAA